MSHSYVSNRVHLVFSTKNREKRLCEEVQIKLWPYMAGIARNHGFGAIKIGGMDDHVHALIAMPATLPLAKAIQTLKACSSKWLNETAVQNFAWQEGYGAFSVSASQTEGVIRYIENQRKHHEKKTFDDEFIALLKRYAVSYDPIHVFG